MLSGLKCFNLVKMSQMKCDIQVNSKEFSFIWKQAGVLQETESHSRFLYVNLIYDLVKLHIIDSRYSTLFPLVEWRDVVV